MLVRDIRFVRAVRLLLSFRLSFSPHNLHHRPLLKPHRKARPGNASLIELQVISRGLPGQHSPASNGALARRIEPLNIE